MPLFLDMDGVLVDFMGGALRRHNRLDVLANYPKGEWAIEKQLGLTAVEFWEPLRGHSFWAELQPYPWFDLLMGIVRAKFGTDFWIATSPSLDPYSASGKIEWLQRYMPREPGGKTFTRHFIGADKYHLARRGAVLIDDNEQNCAAFESFGGIALLFPAPWNKFHGLEQYALDYVRDSLNEVMA